MRKKITPFRANLFFFFKLPAAWLTGVRVDKIDDNSATVKLKHMWINQNPFDSIFWAVQGMAAEISTGVLILKQIQIEKIDISMLVVNNNADFSKKAKGRILFSCNQGEIVRETIKNLKIKKPKIIKLTSIGIDEKGDQVSKFNFYWSLLKK